jgi:hypothetical protein
MSDTIRFAGAAAVLQPATLRMEKALAEDVTPAVVKHFKRMMAESRHECSGGGHNSEALSDAFLERVTRVAKLNTDEIAELVKYLMHELQTTPAEFEASLRPVFINRARIFAASRPAANKDEDVEVVLPDLSLFVHKMFVTVANAVANAQALFLSPSAHSKLNEYDRQRKRAALVRAAVLRSLDIIQPPHAFGLRYFKPADSQAHKKHDEDRSAQSISSNNRRAPRELKQSKDAEPKRHRQSHQNAADKRSQHSSTSQRSSLKTMGFEEEDDEEEKEDIADEHQLEIPEGDEDDQQIEDNSEQREQEHAYEEDPAASARDSAVGSGVKLRNRKAPPPSKHPDELSVLSAQPYYRKGRK